MLNIVYRRVSELIPYVNNTRTHDEKQVSQIASSIKEFGFTNPVLIDEDGGVIAGHGRLLASEKLNMHEVPTITLNGLSKAQKKAYIIADNKLALNAGWDEELLKIELQELIDLDFDITLTGFELDEIDLDPEVETLETEDDVPAESQEVVSVRGDIWVLGNHRLMCGDSTSTDDIDKLMLGKKAHMVFTDPPYNMDFTGSMQKGGTQSFNAKHDNIKNDKMSKNDFADFIDAINTNISIYCDGAFYISFFRFGIADYWNSLNRVGLTVKSLVIWDKGNHTLSNSDYMSMYEPIFYGWVNTHKFYGGNNGRDIWNISRTKKNDLHPTMKPIELIEKCLNDSSKKGDLVLDLFGGSGSTMIACEKNKRVSNIMELEEKYVDVMIKRWQEFTGKEAVLESTGQTYNQLFKEKFSA